MSTKPMTPTGMSVASRVTSKAELSVMPEGYYNKPYAYYFPINLAQVEELLGKMLTHVEAMNLPAGVEKANKDLVRQSIWQWYSDVQENSMTSYQGVIAPIELSDVDPATPDEE